MLSANTTHTYVRTYLAATASISQGEAVATSGTATASDTGDIKGIAAKDHATGDEVLLYPIQEVRPVVLGADSITAGMKLTSDDGKLIQATTAGDVVVAIAMEDGDDGDTVNAWLVSPYELGA